jgi:hypothetical protein
MCSAMLTCYESTGRSCEEDAPKALRWNILLGAGNSNAHTVWRYSFKFSLGPGRSSFFPHAVCQIASIARTLSPPHAPSSCNATTFRGLESRRTTARACVRDRGAPGTPSSLGALCEAYIVLYTRQLQRGHATRALGGVAQTSA